MQYSEQNCNYVYTQHRDTHVHRIACLYARRASDTISIQPTDLNYKNQSMCMHLHREAHVKICLRSVPICVEATQKTTSFSGRAEIAPNN